MLGVRTIHRQAQARAAKLGPVKIDCDVRVSAGPLWVVSVHIRLPAIATNQSPDHALLTADAK
jgi:hypothetical protein